MRERQRLYDIGSKKTPDLNREDIISLVQATWGDINHRRVAEKGYKQTGPSMPMVGPVCYDDVFHDLRTVIQAISK